MLGGPFWSARAVVAVLSDRRPDAHPLRALLFARRATLSGVRRPGFCPTSVEKTREWSTQLQNGRWVDLPSKVGAMVVGQPVVLHSANDYSG